MAWRVSTARLGVASGVHRGAERGEQRRVLPGKTVRRSSTERAVGDDSRSPAACRGGACGRAPRRASRERQIDRDDGIVLRGSEPPPMRDSASTTRARKPERRASATRCSRAPAARRAGFAASRPSGSRRPCRQVEVDGGLEGREDELVAAEGAEERLALQAGDQVCAAGDDAGLRAAEELVAAEGDEVARRRSDVARRSARRRRARRRRGRRRARCRGLRRTARRARARGRRGATSAARRRSLHVEVAAVNLEDHRGLRSSIAAA